MSTASLWNALEAHRHEGENALKKQPSAVLGLLKGISRIKPKRPCTPEKKLPWIKCIEWGINFSHIHLRFVLPP